MSLFAARFPLSATLYLIHDPAITTAFAHMPYPPFLISFLGWPK